MCMHSFHSTHIFIVYNSVICIKPFNILFYNCHTAHFVYSPLNSYVYIHWIFDFKYIIVIILRSRLLVYSVWSEQSGNCFVWI